MSAAFCGALKDNSRNNDCALYQRQTAFKTAKCSGEWPHQTPGGLNQQSSQVYAYQLDGCSTGVHFFGAASEDNMLFMYCKALKDEQLNRSCAKAKRDEEYAKNDCENHH